jgi:hypothetical protein
LHPPDGPDRRSEALDQVERSALAFIEHPSFARRDLAQVFDLSEEAGNRGSRRSDEDIERGAVVVAWLFRDAMNPLKAGKFVDCGQVSRLSFSVLVDGRKDRVDRGRRGNCGRNCSGNGAGSYR